MSVFKYNGVTLPYPLHTGFSAEAQYDEVGGVDWYVTRFDISLDCLINVEYLDTIDGSLVNADGSPFSRNPAAIMKAIRTKLLQPRKALSVQINGVDLIPAQTANGGPIDAKNGPMPQSCKIMQMSDVTFLVSYHIVAHYWENNAVTLANGDSAVANRAGGPVLFNRWTESVDMDENQASTYTREGSLMIRSDNAQGFVADQMRTQMAVVGLTPGCLRQSSNYTASPDGLKLQYRIMDREAHRFPPLPAFTVSGGYTESSTHGGAMRHGECSITLTGPPGGINAARSQKRLLFTALRVALTKIWRAGAVLSKDGQRFAKLDTAVYTIDIENNKVSVQVRSLLKAAPYRTMGIVMNTIRSTSWPVMDLVQEDFVTVRRPRHRAGGIDVGEEVVLAGSRFANESDPKTVGVPPTYNTRGSLFLLLEAARYYDPSLTLEQNQLKQTDRPINVGDGYVESEDVQKVGFGGRRQKSTGVEPGRAGKVGE